MTYWDRYTRKNCKHRRRLWVREFVKAIGISQGFDFWYENDTRWLGAAFADNWPLMQLCDNLKGCFSISITIRTNICTVSYPWKHGFTPRQKIKLILGHWVFRTNWRRGKPFSNLSVNDSMASAFPDACGIKHIDYPQGNEQWFNWATNYFLIHHILRIQLPVTISCCKTLRNGSTEKDLVSTVE